MKSGENRYTVLIRFKSRSDALSVLEKFGRSHLVRLYEEHPDKAHRCGALEIVSTVNPKEIWRVIVEILGVENADQIEGVYTYGNKANMQINPPDESAANVTE